MIEWSKPFDNIAMVASVQRAVSAAFILIQYPSDGLVQGQAFSTITNTLATRAYDWKRVPTILWQTV